MTEINDGQKWYIPDFEMKLTIDKEQINITYLAVIGSIPLVVVVLLFIRARKVAATIEEGDN